SKNCFRHTEASFLSLFSRIAILLYVSGSKQFYPPGDGTEPRRSDPPGCPLHLAPAYGRFAQPPRRYSMKKLLILLLPILFLGTQLPAHAQSVSFGIPLPFPFLFYNFGPTYSAPGYYSGYYGRAYYGRPVYRRPYY